MSGCRSRSQIVASVSQRCVDSAIACLRMSRCISADLLYLRLRVLRMPR